VTGRQLGRATNVGRHPLTMRLIARRKIVVLNKLIHSVASRMTHGRCASHDIFTLVIVTRRNIAVRVAECVERIALTL